MGKLRIIGGRWRSRQLPVADLKGLRPTTDRVRETLFNWLQSDIGGAHCLDLFAGSGALGFEAASRGSASVLMIEKQSLAVKTLMANIQALQADNVQVLQQDAIGWLKSAKAKAYDVVFVDPPFSSDCLVQACQLLEAGHWLAEHACIYLETDSRQPFPELPESWVITKEKKAGQVGYYLIRRNVKKKQEK